ncbi:hypothetical protein ACFO0A_00480 [Novosphingobium tardum]|uniref:Uncharacterized protein n=1 Tax=Novosphingobium tardum TaxID=1538021 RepID=A0ABV8RJH9_9SPHN
MTTKRALLAAGAVLALAGCTGWDPRTGKIEDAGWGEANRQTIAAQVIDPDPQYEYVDPETSGLHAAQAIERYRTDRVKQPVTTSTTQGSN